MTMECPQFCVCLPNVPGTLGKMTSMLAQRKVNITGLMIEDLGDISYVRMNVDKPSGARAALAKAGFEVFQNPCFRVEVPNRPGVLAKLASALGRGGVNIRHIYGTGDRRETCCLMVVVDQPAKARPVLARFVRSLGGSVR